MPLISGSIGAGLQYAAQQQTNATNLQIARETNQFNSAEAQKNRDWETEMSNTAIQRSMADYKAAGLNPWLAVQGGASGASTPSGSSAHGVAAEMEAPNIGGLIGNATAGIRDIASTAVAVKMMKNAGASLYAGNIARALKTASSAGLVRSLLKFFI